MSETQKRVANFHGTQVEKARLLTTLAENREAHRVELGEALTGYYAAAADEITTLMEKQRLSFERNIQRAKEHSDELRVSWDRLTVHAVKPQDHSDEFDAAIAKLEWETADQVVLGKTEFENFVLNKWAWTKDHLTSVASFSNYLNGQSIR